MTKLITIMLLALSARHLPAQGEVQVSSLVAEPAMLDCRQHSTTKVTAQVYFTGIMTSDDGRKAVTLHLGIYSSEPPANRLKVVGEDKTVELRVSPAVMEFEVSCSAETKSGEVTLVATISKAPAGTKIDIDPLFPATVKVARTARTVP